MKPRIVFRNYGMWFDPRRGILKVRARSADGKEIVTGWIHHDRRECTTEHVTYYYPNI
jgi:hypothetical protein